MIAMAEIQGQRVPEKKKDIMTTLICRIDKLNTQVEALGKAMQTMQETAANDQTTCSSTNEA